MIDDQMIDELGENQKLKTALCEYRNYISNFNGKYRKISSDRARLIVEKACQHFVRFIADASTEQPAWVGRHGLALLDELYRLQGMAQIVKLTNQPVEQDIASCIKMFLKFVPLPASSNSGQSEGTANLGEGTSGAVYEEKEKDGLSDAVQEPSQNKEANFGTLKLAAGIVIGAAGIGLSWYYFSNKKDPDWEPEALRYGASAAASGGALLKTAIGTIGLGGLGGGAWLAKQQGIFKENKAVASSETDKGETDEELIARLKNTYRLESNLNETLDFPENEDELEPGPSTSFAALNTDAETQALIKHLKETYSLAELTSSLLEEENNEEGEETDHQTETSTNDSPGKDMASGTEGKRLQL